MFPGISVLLQRQSGILHSDSSHGSASSIRSLAPRETARNSGSRNSALFMAETKLKMKSVYEKYRRTGQRGLLQRSFRAAILRERRELYSPLYTVCHARDQDNVSSLWSQVSKYLPRFLARKCTYVTDTSEIIFFIVVLTDVSYLSLPTRMISQSCITGMLVVIFQLTVVCLLSVGPWTCGTRLVPCATRRLLLHSTKISHVIYIHVYVFATHR